jgi:rhomboid protease GluP
LRSIEQIFGRRRSPRFDFGARLLHPRSMSDSPANKPSDAAPPGLRKHEQQHVLRERMIAFNRELAPYTPRVWVVWAILAVNVAVFAVQLAFGVKPISPALDDLVKWGADFGPLTTHGQWWRPFSCMFVHGGIVHLAMNMLVLASIGPFMERLLGNAGFFVVYVFAGLAGSLLSLAHAPQIVSMGASGAIFGLYGALAGFLVRAHGTLPKDVLQSLWRMAGAFVVYNFLYGMHIPGIDQAAHIGGLVGGFVGGLVLGHSLDAAAFAGRMRRTVILVALGFFGFVGATRAFPPVVDFRAELETFASVETQVLDRVNGASEQNQKGKLSDEGEANVLEKEALPPWRAELERLRSLPRLDAKDAKLRDQLVTMMNYRAEGWQLTIDGIRQNDDSLKNQGQRKEAAADAIVNALSQKK